VKTSRSGASASSEVGTASSTRLATTPYRRSILRLNSAVARPATAIPSVQALTAIPAADGETA
jgi:hypothetical protein